MDPAFTDLRWFIVVGLVLVSMAIAGSSIRRLPLSSSIIYLAVGAVVGPLGLGLLVLDPLEHAPALARSAGVGRSATPARSDP